MPLFRRREPLHERLAREGGLNYPAPEAASPPGWMESGIHGVPRQREWDAVVAVEAEGVEGNEARFVALPDETLLVEEGGDVEPLAQALDDVVKPPYRAEAVRRGETQWAVGVRRIEVVELQDDPGGEELTLTVRDGERELLVDGAPTFGSIPDLERLGATRGDSYVVQGRRLDGALWEVRVAPL
ncbi:MAG TPA: hypothetical protein VJT84_07850 [Gaiellaceae bacterium]|nr:hypothetical protein [Gaiellaceae bacterium]